MLGEPSSTSSSDASRRERRTWRGTATGAETGARWIGTATAGGTVLEVSDPTEVAEAVGGAVARRQMPTKQTAARLSPSASVTTARRPWQRASSGPSAARRRSPDRQFLGGSAIGTGTGNATGTGIGTESATEIAAGNASGTESGTETILATALAATTTATTTASVGPAKRSARGFTVGARSGAAHMTSSLMGTSVRQPAGAVPTTKRIGGIQR